MHKNHECSCIYNTKSHEISYKDFRLNICIYFSLYNYMVIQYSIHKVTYTYIVTYFISMKICNFISNGRKIVLMAKSFVMELGLGFCGFFDSQENILICLYLIKMKRNTEYLNEFLYNL